MKLDRKTLGSLITEKYQFYIPDYQRGYKWTNVEVFKLLNDLWEFRLNHPNENDSSFYCLQPVVVKPVDGKYYVIDGQQRLTTLLVIQQAIKDYNLLKFSSANSLSDIEALPLNLRASVSSQTYSIEYQTRTESSVWLDKRMNEPEMKGNSDYSHIYDAYILTIDFLKWIDKGTPADFELEGIKCPEYKKRTNACFDFDTCLKDRCNVIWYELDTTNDTDHEIFDRLNTGKIPLTNAELIKAMLLQEGNFPLAGQEKIKSEDYRTSIARQWDDFEKELQNPSFWNFIYDAKAVGMKYDTRIEFLFDLLAGKTKENSDRFYFTFDYYDALFQEYKEAGKDAIDFVNTEWERVRELIQTLKDWYDNKTYYHYIGYLISQGCSVNDIKDIQFPRDDKGNKLPVPKKKDFIGKLEELIRNMTSQYRHEDLMKSCSGLTPVLLLFNVLTVLDNSDDSDRFPFHYYKNTVWNEEHVSPDTPFEPNNEKRCFQFAAQMLEYYTDISFYEVLDRMTRDNMMLPKRDRRKAAQLVKNAMKEVTPEIEKYIEQNEDDVFCKDLLAIFAAHGKNQEELSKRVFNDISKSLGIKDTDNSDNFNRDYIWNQVLLDEGTNKSYGNAIFPYKRMRIIKNTTNGVFVPSGTYNVFVKAYSRRMTNMLEWSMKDGLRYLAVIFSTLNRDGRNFLSKELLEQENLPEYVKYEELKKLIDNGK